MSTEMGSAFRQMPRAMHKIGLVFMFQWYALPIYWQFLAVANGQLFFDADPESGGTAWEMAVAWTGMQGAVTNTVQACVGLFVLVAIIQKVGAKKVQVLAYILAAGSLVAFTQTGGQQWLGLVALIGFCIATASMFALPAMTVTTLVPAKRLGIYIAIMNMMMVVPMIIQSLTFGWIYENILGSSATNAFLFAAGLFAVGALAILWVDPPSADQESFLVPLGAPRHVKSVYNNVIVGSDGSPTSLVTVGHAAGLAHAAEAKLVVVTAYDQDTNVVTGTEANQRQVLHGKAAADAAMEASLRSPVASTDHNIREFEGRVVAAGPAQALLDAAGDDPANLIVVGNRGLGAEEGQLLGSVPTEVVRSAVCNVMIVQTTRHSEDLKAITASLEVQTSETQRD